MDTIPKVSSDINTSASLPSPKHDDEKYDRQLRLWGADGQKRLMQARILLLYASPSGVETLKNLVLPGVGEICILDNNLVTDGDCNNNFFVSTKDKGKPRAKVVLDYLLEMNPDVKGFYVHTEGITPLEYLTKESNFLQSFSLVIGADLCETEMIEVNKLVTFSKTLTENNKTIGTKNTLPIVFVRTYGLIGYLRLILPEHLIMNTKMANKQKHSKLYQLRIHDPYRELIEMASSIKYSTEDQLDYAGLPYVIILIKSLLEFSKQKKKESQLVSDTTLNDETLKTPSNSQEKEEFKALLLIMNNEYIEWFQNIEVDGKKVNEDTLPENLSDAIENLDLVSHGYKTQIPENIEMLFEEYTKVDLSLLYSMICDHQPINSLDLNIERTKEHFIFWVIVGGIHKFFHEHHFLPCSGSIPDMTSSTHYFIQMQNLYCQQSEKHIDLVESYVNEILISLQKQHLTKQNTTRDSLFSINRSIISNYCKLSYHLSYLRTRDVIDERQTPNKETIKDVFEEAQCMLQFSGEDSLEMVPYLFYLALRGVDAYYEENNYRFPGQGIPFSEAEAAQIKELDLEKDSPVAWNSNNDIEAVIDNVFNKTISIAKTIIKSDDTENLDEIDQFCSNSVYPILRKHVKEMCRYSGARLHNMAALMGGVAAQEVIKILTCQYIPLDNTYIFNGISSSGVCYSL